MFKGSIVAIVTPFKDGQFDQEQMRSLIEFQIENGTDAILPCGCTGEAATLSHEEQKAVIKFTIEVVNRRVPVIAGTGSNNTTEALALTNYAKSAGADGALLITPYYNKPTPEGQYRHYELIAGKVDIPIVLYNVPGRTGVSMFPETIARLSEIDNIVAVKEAAGSLDQVSSILSLCNITVLSGDDSLTLPMMAVGAKGVISVVANIAPKETSDLIAAFEAKDLERAKVLHYKLFPLVKAMFYETNPIPVKTSLMLMGKGNGEFRLPLCEMSDSGRIRLEKTLKECGVIK